MVVLRLLLPALLVTSIASSSQGGPAKVPVDLLWRSGGRIDVALRDARSVIAVDVDQRRVAREWPLPFRPLALAPAGAGETLLVGGQDGELAVLDESGRGPIRTFQIGRGPTRVVALADGRVAVAPLWDNSVSLVDWRTGKVLAVHRLPFSPGSMVACRDERIIIADAFGGNLAALRPGVAGSERLHRLDGLNLRGLALSPDGKELLVAHAMQYGTVPITNANIDWGLVLSSRLSAIRLSELDVAGREGATLPRRRLTLDGAVHGAADPSALAVTSDGHKVVIALAGAHQLLLNDRSLGSPTTDALDLLPLGHFQKLDVVEVGRSPAAIAIDPSGVLAASADAMSDTVSIVSLEDFSDVTTIPLGEREPERTAQQRGEALFHDGRRSHDRWMTCASCHPSGHTNGLSFDTLGDGDYGAPKNTPTLLGVGSTAPYAWTGRFPTLEAQVHQSLESSLRGPAPDDCQLADLSAFLQSLSPPPPLRSTEDPAAKRGEVIFRSRGCESCHRAPHYSSKALREVGLKDAAGHSRFNPPSLRAVARTAPYFHDGSAATLGEVIDTHAPGRSDLLSAAERADLIAFLESL
ncbi:MAG: cytochrome c peroxidase [Isosphaeraceae bacterium]|nr:cytochrome c peroxidase [Isosphaeraceae bacterium]